MVKEKKEKYIENGISFNTRNIEVNLNFVWNENMVLFVMGIENFNLLECLLFFVWLSDILKFVTGFY